ncbi:CGI-121-domain-containing protein, partial [Paraphaeosphaeria sporulosa]
AHIHTLTLPHYPTHPVHIALFCSVTNAPHLRSQLLSSNSAFDYAFLDATVLLSPTHLLLAAQLALHAHLTGRGRTRTPHSELVFRLHPNNNIGEAYRKVGMGDESGHVLVVKFGGLEEDVTAESVAKHLGMVVEGESVEIAEEMGEVGMFADVGKIRKIYKLGEGGAKGKGKKGTDVNGDGTARDERKDMESVILGTMALKGS